jgi:hypothetical protein
MRYQTNNNNIFVVETNTITILNTVLFMYDILIFFLMHSIVIFFSVDSH